MPRSPGIEIRYSYDVDIFYTPAMTGFHSAFLTLFS